MKRSPLKRGTRRTLSLAEREQAWVFKEAAMARWCAGCHVEPISYDAHHVVSARELRSRALPVYDPRNALAVCRHCHERHENASHRIPFAALTEANLEYAREVLGDYADDYLDRFYPGRVRHGDNEEADDGT